MSALEDVPAAERAVVGAVLTDPACLRFAAEVVSPDDFADTRIGALYGLVAGMVSSGLPVDLVTVGAEVQARRAELVKFPLWSEVVRWRDEASPGSVAHYAEIVRRESLRRATDVILRQTHQALSAGGDPSVALSGAITALREVQSGSGGFDASQRLLADVLAEDDVYEWVIPGLLERQDRVMVTGGEGAGKSTLVRQMAVCAAAGLHPFTLRPIQPLTVLVVDAENSERQWRRNARPVSTQARIRGQRDPGAHLHLACRRRMDITKDRDLGALHQLLDEVNPDLLMIGPLYRLVPTAITNDDHAAPVLAALDSLRDRGPALVMEAHAGHAQTKGGDRDLRPRGSSALLGWPEFGFGLTLTGKVDAHNKPAEARLVRWRGDREERGWPDRMARGGAFPWTPADSVAEWGAA